jgi:hypothetical protein
VEHSVRHVRDALEPLEHARLLDVPAQNRAQALEEVVVELRLVHVDVFVAERLQLVEEHVLDLVERARLPEAVRRVVEVELALVPSCSIWCFAANRATKNF